MKKVRLMDKVFELPILAIILALLSSCVDEFEDANPPPLLDAPAVNSLSVNDTLVNGGQTLSLSINVTDAPGGIDSVGASAQDGNGIERGSFTVETPLTGQTSGEIIITYTAIDGYSGEATLSVAVFDRQFDEDGELVRKNSVPRTQEVTILCRQLASRYSVLGEFLVDDFDSPDVTNREIVAAVDCGSDSYEVADITGGLYTTTYEEEYDTDPAEAVFYKYDN